MAEKTYFLENLGCANCAAKMEAKINALPQVESAVITFATGQLRVTAPDPDALLPQMQKIVRSIESNVHITDTPTHTHVHCHHCEDAHEHHHHHNHHDHAEEKHELPGLLIGAGLFALGLLLGRFPIPSGLLFLAAYLILGWEVLSTAGKNLIKGHIFDENFLMSLATLGAFAIREFPEAVGVMLFYRIGELFEHKAVARSRQQIMDAVDLRPDVVTLLHGDHVETVPAEQAQPGDLLLVRPGDRIPLDGVVIAGQSRIDTAPITGEPVPVAVAPGDRVISGCVNTSGQLTVQVEKPLSESMVTRILHAVENAAAGKPRIDRFITRFARIYTPVVVAAAVLTAVIPSLISGDWDYWVYTALSFLVMSCPCALVLSVPLAFFSGIGLGGRQGILFKGGASIEALANIKAVALDKTGTLTHGDFRVQRIVGDRELLAICAACEQNSSHPIAQSIAAHAKAQGITPDTPETLEELPGQGIRCVLQGKTVLCGNAQLMALFSVSVPQSLPQEPGSLVLVAVDGVYAGYLLISDTLKPDAMEAVAALKKQGVSVAMFTGDAQESAQAVAGTVGIDRVFARLLPSEKLTQLQALRKEKGATMFIGDGINDAPVLAGADVGAAMGSGTDAAIEAADVVYMKSQVSAIPASISIARRTKSIAWQNVVFALGIKAVVMVLGLLGYASMWMAVFADSGVAMLCVLNAIRLLYRKS